jgi:alpha-glucosidase (family GH31 glycosyl hydrolase)
MYQPKKIEFTPIADKDAVILGPNVRFSILTDHIIRMEYSPDGDFEDRPSQVFWYRKQDVPEFKAIVKQDMIEIITSKLHLRYEVQDRGFYRRTLSIEIKGTPITWRYGDVDKRNLKGTGRTLDRASGEIPLENGLISRSGWALIDDSESLVFNESGWLEDRESSDDTKDLYFFGYGTEYQECLYDYFKLAGPVPMLPRWALGNWWSRYWEYTQQELLALMSEFKTHQIPLSVCIVDMDWHVTDTGNASRGWTGYTWNKELFPAPEKFLYKLQELGLKSALNLHPAAGVYPHEEMYPQMAKHMGIDPETEQPVEFDIADPKFTEAYFDLLHHPYEGMGVDFWWLDWQQGTKSAIKNLDPLWWLNHLHFYDLGRDGEKRPFIFSRWGGLGNHRYPIGFSGDTYANWESLAFQPYFTSTAANVGYGWWSHDIGGHMGGIESPELFTRWVQFGVFSPIFRLHSTKNPFHERLPWGYDANTLLVTRDALQLRHGLIPYLYTMSWINAYEGVALVRPMYHDYPEHDEAYFCPGQYAFGSELIAAPFTSKADEDTRLSRQVVWLPEGQWFNFFDGEYFEGGGWQAIYGGMDDIPVFAKAGAIVPLGPMVDWGGVDNPSELTIHIFAGADNTFWFYEDDGETTAYLDGRYCITELNQKWSQDSMEFTILPPIGDLKLLPERRNYQLQCHGIKEPDGARILLGGKESKVSYEYDTDSETLILPSFELPFESRFQLTLVDQSGNLLSKRNRTRDKVIKILKASKMDTWVKQEIYDHLDEIIENPLSFERLAYKLNDRHILAFLEVILGVSKDRVSYDPDEAWADLLVKFSNH